MSTRDRRPTPWWLPILVAGALTALYLGWAYRLYDGQPEAIFHVGDPQQGTGYDGQFVYFMARDLNPQRVAAHLDVPAYRYQRILLPLLAHLLAGDDPQRVLWAVWGVNFLGYLAGLWVWASWLRAWQVSPWWALLYGLWPGLLLPLRLGMPEPLTYGLALVGMTAAERRHYAGATLALAAALLTKEITLPFVLAIGIALWLRGQRREAGMALSGALLSWLAWQGWLWATFGRPGVGIGGLGAQPPWPFPFGGLAQVFWRLPAPVLALYLVVFGPSLLVPLALGFPAAYRWLRHHAHAPWGWLLAFHLALAAAMPMLSWEVFAAFRVLTGLMIAFWAVALQERRLHWLYRLLPFWGALLAFTIAR